MLIKKFAFRKKAFWIKGGMILFAAIFLFSGLRITSYFWDRNKSQAEYDSIQHVYYSVEDTDEEKTDQQEDNTDKYPTNPILANFHPLLKENDDTVGWLRISNTVIDYPILQGNDNQFYLNYTFRKEKNKSGALFMDFRNSVDTLDQNTIIYGHNMKDGSMFGELRKYRNETFFQENDVIVFNALYEEMEWKIFSVFLSDTTFNYIKPEFHDGESFEKFIQRVKEVSMYATEMEITENDHILTLSTCASDFDDARLVVMAKLVKN